jgi:hypothetical protein
MSDPLKSFTTDELHALIFRLDLSETIEPLDEVAAELCDEMMREIKARDAWFSDDEFRYIFGRSFRINLSDFPLAISICC